MTVQRVNVVLQFYAEMKDGVAGDDQADAISEELVEILRLNSALTRLGVFGESYEVVDWTSHEEPPAEGEA